jgi:hypothetical protein
MKNELPMHIVYLLKHSYHGLVETMQMQNLPHLEGHLHLSENILYYFAKICCFGMVSAMAAGFLRQLALNSNRSQILP